MTNTTQSDNNQRIRLVVILILLATVALIPFEILLDESHPVCIHLYFPKKRTGVDQKNSNCAHWRRVSDAVCGSDPPLFELDLTISSPSFSTPGND
jgi:hypothetical protein